MFEWGGLVTAKLQQAGQFIWPARSHSSITQQSTSAWRSHVSAVVVAVLAYLVAVLTMGVYDEEQCDKGGAARDDDDDNWQGTGSKLFGVGGGVGYNKEEQWRRVEEACRWARYTSLSHLRNCLRSDPELCRAMLLMLGTWWRS
jgi:hypothetical protein